jgi:hypothetical protein
MPSFTRGPTRGVHYKSYPHSNLKGDILSPTLPSEWHSLWCLWKQLQEDGYATLLMNGLARCRQTRISNSQTRCNWEPATKTISLQIWLNLLVSGNTNWSSSPFSWAQQTFDASTFLFKHLKKSSHSFSCPMRSCHHDNLIIQTASTRISCNDVCCKDSSNQWLADIMPQSSDGKDKYTMHWQTDCNWLGPATHSMMQCIAWCDHPLHAESWDPRTGINISQHNMSRVQFMELNPSIMNNKKNVITCHQLNAQ